LSKLVTSTLENLNLAVNLKKKILQKYRAAVIFFLYGNENVPSAKILRGRRCLRTRTFILFGLINLFFFMEKGANWGINSKMFGRYSPLMG
jgi:hypothetical protein